MRAYIFESSMSILINGSPIEDFKVERGLRQGDPLSPFLFLIVVEGLVGLMRRAVEIGKFKGYQSKIYGINVDARLLAAGSSFLSCRSKVIPFIFLGIPVGANPRRRETWKQVVDSMSKSEIQRNFLWGGGLEDKKLCWVKWDQICLPKEQGGLGVKNLDLFNRALLCKWKWRFLIDNNRETSQWSWQWTQQLTDSEI
ncbi:ribonuclease H [Trifolium pratense]|uniref:Ribonuclease H n=1 Tax=Trifolium pratense TaxID=57577 RepID=A0A2K3NES1_TRIPR|nr:ribonuclease H [Trifolium pratense]